MRGRQGDLFHPKSASTLGAIGCLNKAHEESHQAFA